jgi:hypothetical protein
VPTSTRALLDLHSAMVVLSSSALRPPARRCDTDLPQAAASNIVPAAQANKANKLLSSSLMHYTIRASIMPKDAQSAYDACPPACHLQHEWHVVHIAGRQPLQCTLGLEESEAAAWHWQQTQSLTVPLFISFAMAGSGRGCTYLLSLKRSRSQVRILPTSKKAQHQ